MSTSITASTIAATAFRMMELSPISSLSDDSPKAAAAAEQFPHAIDMCLQSYDWSFARHMVKLPSTDLPEKWISDDSLPFLYALPGDCVQVRHVEDTDCEWRRDGDYLRADVDGGLVIRYTQRITNEKRLPSAFQAFVSSKLASLLATAPGFVRSTSKVDRIHAMVSELEIKAVDYDTFSGSSRRADDLPTHTDWATEAVR